MAFAKTPKRIRSVDLFCFSILMFTSVQSLRDLQRGARGLAQHVAESTYAQLVDMMARIVAHNRLRDGSLENATCAREATKQTSTSGGENLDWSIDSAPFLAFTR